MSWTQPAALVALLLGFAAFAVSRTGGPLCAPDSWLQGHGVWHVMGAIALGLWALGALPETANDTDDQHLVEAAEPQSGSRATRNDPGRSEPTMRAGLLLIRVLADILTDVGFRSVDVRRRGNEPGGAELILASHAGGLADILLVIKASHASPDSSPAT